MLGNLVRFVEDVKATNTSNGETLIVKGRVAENVGSGNTRFFTFTAFARKGEDGKYHGPANTISQYSGKKGQQILLVGSLNNNDYTNKDGQKVYGYDFIVNSCELVGNSTSSTQTTPTAASPAANTNNDGFVPIPNEFQFN